jgi:carboxyl-terminal processing protease
VLARDRDLEIPMTLRTFLVLAFLPVACGSGSLPAGGSSAPRESPGTASPSADRPANPPDRVATTASAPFDGGEAAFRTVKETLLKKYAGASVSEDALYRAAIQGMLEHVDAQRGGWNKLLSPYDLDAIRSDLQGEVVGVGAEIHFDPVSGYSDVVGVLPGSPAEKAKVAPGDKIVDVNGRLFVGKTVRDVLAEIRGKAGETVTLTVLRADKLLVLPIVRERVAYDVTRDLMLPDSVGYLQIKSFNAKTRAGIDRGLAELADHHARALVVDLRGNPGGSFDDAISSAEAFLPAGATIVRVEKRDPKDQAHLAKGATTLADVPMAVLVDGDTSSGGEFVTAALQEARHATVVGRRTFGKWSLQTIDDLPNGYAVKYTVGVLRSGSGKTYEGVGLEPDVEVDADKNGVVAAAREADPAKRVAMDPALRTAIALLRR